MKFIRITLILFVTALFFFLAFYLYQRQQEEYTFLSFKLEENATSIIIPDIDRLVAKMDVAEEMEQLNINGLLKQGVNAVLQDYDNRINADFGQTCFLSFNTTDFVLAFSNPDLTYRTLVDVLNTKFNLKTSYKKTILKVEEKKYNLAQYGVFTVISSLDIVPAFNEAEMQTSNADYYVFKDSFFVDRFILANNEKYKVWTEITVPVRGSPIEHLAYIQKIPVNFDAVYFYGSQRLMEDKNSFFHSPSEEEFKWVGDGIMILKKGSFELMIAPQNEDRDLILILEEQTLNLQADSSQINYFTRNNFEIMEFTTNYNWQNSIPGLSQILKYYTEFSNFNVLSNSTEAMEWYLAEMQTGNLVEEKEDWIANYTQSTPLKSHYISIVSNPDEIIYESATWIEKTKCTKTYTKIVLGESSQNPNNSVSEFSIAFSPKYLIPFTEKKSATILVANKNKIAVYNEAGIEKWEVILPSALIAQPEIIDLEQDGVFEFLVFLENNMIVYNTKGEKINRLNIAINQPIIGGLVVNYDNKYDYRFFILTKHTIDCYNEKGKKVEGWQFSGSEDVLTNESAYVQIDNKDYLTFKDVNDQFLVLNRKGEDRFETRQVVDLPNESNFLVGKDVATLRKIGYKQQYIYNQYINDVRIDSIKLDKRVNAIKAEWIMLTEPFLLIEEPSRVLLFNVFGYLEEEVLKPKKGVKLIGTQFKTEIYYVFYDSSKNSVSLLNSSGKLVLSDLASNSEIYGITDKQFYTVNGTKIKVLTLK